jgi:hypothetical protein
MDLPFLIAQAEAPDPKCNATIEVFSTDYQVRPQISCNTFTGRWRVGYYFVEIFCDCTDDIRITETMKSIFPYSFGLCYFGVDGVHPAVFCKGHVETTIEKGDVLDPF